MSDDSTSQSAGEQLTPEAIDSEIASIRGDKDYLAGEGSTLGGNRHATELNARMQFLYTQKFKEPSGRQGEIDHGVSDMARKEFGPDVTPEKIKGERDGVVEELNDQAIERQAIEAETTLKAEFGGPEAYEEKLGYAYAIKDAYLNSPEDQEWLNGPAGNDPDLIRKLSDLGEYISKKYHNNAHSGYMKKREQWRSQKGDKE